MSRRFLFFCSLGYVFLLVSLCFYMNINKNLPYILDQENAIKKINIVGKAAIGEYLWIHLLNGTINYNNHGFFQYGNLTVDNIFFEYISGPGYIQTTIPQHVSFLVLVLNGRTGQHASKAVEWLEYLRKVSSLKKLAVVLLGNEQCENDWILKYMKSRGGLIDVMFVVYDAGIVDDKEIFQWPLGVATYRGFPSLNDIKVENIFEDRKYKCNFLGTIYKNSSREILNHVLENDFYRQICFLSTREKWTPFETEETLKMYINALLESDFTLSPVGANTECYRIYEAMSLGSIPIVEDNLTPGKCQEPLRLLKKYDPPFLFIKNWTDLSEILINNYSTYLNIVDRRKKIISWYSHFKKSIAEQFIFVLKNSFFNDVIE